jgi:hypothetical protein
LCGGGEWNWQKQKQVIKQDIFLIIINKYYKYLCLQKCFDITYVYACIYYLINSKKAIFEIVAVSYYNRNIDFDFKTVVALP